MRVITCAYCGATVAAEDGLVSAAAFRRALADLDEEARERTDLVAAGVPYRLIGRVAEGESSDVFLAERAHAIGERVMLKMLRAREDAAFLEHEWDALSALASSTAKGAPQLSRRLPQLVARGVASGRATEDRACLVVRASSGFAHTFDDVRAAHPSGVDAQHAVWMWRRILELLGFVHASGWAHGAILPQHLVVHARDHGVMAVGWSRAARLGSPLRARHGARASFYPADVLAGAPVTARTDIAMSARSVAMVLGGNPATGEVPSSVPPPIAALVRAYAESPANDDAWAVADAVAHAARRAFGPPRYVPFHVPAR